MQPGHLSRSASAPDFQCKMAGLLQALATVGCHFAVAARLGAPRGSCAIWSSSPPGLAARRWLEANPDGAAVFTALYATRMPPPLVRLHQILAGLLPSRFGAPPAAAAA